MTFEYADRIKRLSPYLFAEIEKIIKEKNSMKTLLFLIPEEAWIGVLIVAAIMMIIGFRRAALCHFCHEHSMLNRQAVVAGYLLGYA
jgi:hypothetical protein